MHQSHGDFRALGVKSAQIKSERVAGPFAAHAAQVRRLTVPRLN